MSLLRAQVDRLLAPGAVRAVRQPIVRVRDGSVVGWESLARFSTDDGPLPPLEALDLADRDGRRLDLELACVMAGVADGAAPGEGRLFLNTSPQLLLDDRFATLIPQLPPHVLEITEHEPVSDYVPLRERLRGWQESGTLIAIDDVGAGYSTMAHVVRLTPAFIKIDRSLVAGVHVDREQRALVSALAAFASQIGASCIAEGVELAAELDVLTDLGIDLVQGFLVAHPAPGWPGPADTVRRSGSVAVLAGPSKPFQRMSAALDLATAPDAAADAVCRYLFEHRRLLPSVYLMRAGRLRCIARKGQWQVLDGMPSGTGITGQAFAQETEVIARDVNANTSYRAAIPGVRAEMALPLIVDGNVIGVLNADSLTALTEADIAALRSCAEQLGERLGVIGTGLERTTPLQVVSRLARQTSPQQPVAVIAQKTVDAAVAMSIFDTSALFLHEDIGFHLAAVAGEQATVLAGLTQPEVRALHTLVEGVGSIHTGGGALDVTFGPIGALRDRGVRAVMVVPVQAEGDQRGVLLATSSRTATVPAPAVEALELVGLHIGTTLAAHVQLEQVQELAFKDSLTGVANRTLFERVLSDGSAHDRWLAIFDVDRFKQINDRLGHAAGDDALRAVARALEDWSGDDDQVFRLGGDEFAVLMTRVDESAARRRVALIAATCGQHLGPLGAGISAGMAPLDPHHDRAGALAAADRELYRCKGSGGLTRSTALSV